MEILKLKNGFEIEIAESNSINSLKTAFSSLDQAEEIKENLSEPKNLEKICFIKDKTETAYEYMQLVKLDIQIGEERSIEFGLDYRDKNEIEKAKFKTEQSVQNEAINELAMMMAEMIGGSNG